MIRLLTGNDIDEVNIYLERNYLETVSLRGNLDHCGLENDYLSRRSGDYYGYYFAGQLRGVLAFYNLGSVMPHFEDIGAANEFAQIMLQRRWKVLAGVKRVVAPICQALKPGRPVLDYEDSYYLANYDIKPIPLPDWLQIVGIDMLDRMHALTFIVEAYRVGFKRRFNREMAAKLIDECSPEEEIAFLLAAGVPKALAMVQVATDRIHQIGGVYTSFGSRGQGYCQALVSWLCKRSKACGKLPVLMVRKDNLPALHAYRAIGFTYVADYLVAKF